MMYTFLNEILGLIIDKNDQFSFVFNDFYSNYNIVIYNIYSIIFYLYFLYVFRSYISKTGYRKYILIGGIVFLAISIINPLLQNFVLEAQVFTYVTGGTLLICCSLLYFKELKVKFSKWFLKRDLLSWISLGMLLFYLGYLPIKILRYYRASSALLLEPEAPYIRRIHLLLILLMYGCFIVGFLKMRRRRDIISV